jgi:hypothetical protein
MDATAAAVAWFFTGVVCTVLVLGVVYIVRFPNRKLWTE